jgi:hypothetical protein
MFHILVSTDVKHGRGNKYAVVSIDFPEIYVSADTLREVVDSIPQLKALIEAKKNPPN